MWRRRKWGEGNRPTNKINKAAGSEGGWVEYSILDWLAMYLQ